MYCNTLLATYANILGRISSSKLMLSPRLNAQKMMRMENDNVIEVDSYILKPGHLHTSTAYNSSGVRKPLDMVGKLENLFRACLTTNGFSRQVAARRRPML